jgi:uncharacterized DUF497 family protein
MRHHFAKANGSRSHVLENTYCFPLLAIEIYVFSVCTDNVLGQEKRGMYVWDEEKNKKNKIKHKVSFEEASTVFSDPEAIITENRNQVYESRQTIIGYSYKNRQVFVVFFEEEENENIRIISARKLKKADKKSLGWL